MRYWPNPSHKSEATEAGPPRWRPHKSLCPPMSREERDALLQNSVPVDPADPRSRRYALRRVADRVELYEAQCGSGPAEDPEFHGYPWRHPGFHAAPRPVPPQVLRVFLERGWINELEYRRALKGKLFSQGADHDHRA